MDAAGEEPLVVEAPTAAQALEVVTSQLGPDATILAANRITRGGIAGFFARELVQLHARPRTTGDGHAGAAGPDAPPAGTDAAAAGPVPAAAGTDAAPAGADPVGEGPDAPAAVPDAPAAGLGSAGDGEPAVTRVLRQLADDVEEQETTFADALRRQLSLPDPPADVPPATTRVRPSSPSTATPSEATPLEVTRAEVPPAVAPSRRSWEAPAWNDRNLRLLGMPALVTDAVAGLRPEDDLAWVQAIAGAVSTLCRPLPEGPAVYAGPRAERLAVDLDVPVSNPPASAPVSGPFAAVTGDTDRERAWLAGSSEGRWLHLVVGGDDWRGLMLDEPLAVSWVGDRAIGDAIRLCAELGLVLGYGAGAEAGGPARRANPVDVALTIRSLLPRE